MQLDTKLILRGQCLLPEFQEQDRCETWCSAVRAHDDAAMLLNYQEHVLSSIPEILSPYSCPSVPVTMLFHKRSNTEDYLCNIGGCTACYYYGENEIALVDNTLAST